MDFSEMFIPSRPLFEIIVRGSIVYLFLFGIFRFFRSMISVSKFKDDSAGKK